MNHAVSDPPINLDAMQENAGAAARLMKALSNENRLMILCLLTEGELTVGELNRRVPLSQSALSQHLAVLRRDGLVSTRRVSQTIHYALSSGHAARVIALLHELFCEASCAG